MIRERDTFEMFQQPERGRFGENEERRERSRGPHVTGASDFIDLDMVHHVDRSTEKAAFLSFTGMREGGRFLPKSQIEIVETGAVERRWQGTYDQKVRITLPEWLAKEKGLI